MTQGTLERGGAETCNCCKTRLATSQPLISSQKRAKRAWMRLRRITNQEKKITGLLESLRRKELNCHVVPVLQKKRQVVVSCEILLQKVESSSTFCNKTCTSVADPGPGGSPPLIPRPKWGLKGRKNIFLRPPSPSISGSGWWPGTPPYLKVWILHCTCCEFKRLKQSCCNSCVWRDSYVILSNQRLVFTQLPTSWFVARQA